MFEKDLEQYSRYPLQVKLDELLMICLIDRLDLISKVLTLLR